MPAVDSEDRARQPGLVAILPCTDIDAAESLLDRLGFRRKVGSQADYRMLADSCGGRLHLPLAGEGELDPECNPLGLYLFRRAVDAVAAAFAARIIGRDGPNLEPWGMHEFAVNGPDNMLVRIGWHATSRSGDGSA